MVNGKELTIGLLLSISINTIKANLPVIDIGSIAQSILQYSQMVQEFVKYEAELRALGIGSRESRQYFTRFR